VCPKVNVYSCHKHTYSVSDSIRKILHFNEVSNKVVELIGYIAHFMYVILRDMLHLYKLMSD